MRYVTTFLALTFLVMCLMTQPAWATELVDGEPSSWVLALSDSDGSSAGGDGANGDPFAQGSWVFQTYGSAALGDTAGELYTGHVGVGYHFFDDVSVNVDLALGYMDIADRGGSSGGESVFGGVDVLFRGHFWRGRGWSLYAEGGGGLMQSNESYPAHGTHFNFRTHIGMGATVQLADNLLLMGGARWLHVSNGYLLGDDNPGADMAMLYLGVMMPF